MFKGIGKEFMEKTKIKNMPPSDQSQKLPHPPLEMENISQEKPISLPMPLPAEIEDAALAVNQAIRQRRSVRQYSDKWLTLAELSYLLWYTQGVKSVEPQRFVTLRTVPSAGARHAFETYISVNRVEGLKPGLYRYLAIDHKLLPVCLSEKINHEIARACPGQKFIMSSAATFIWTALVYRMAYRHGERGYRYLHLDAGHVCQNLYLAAEVIDSGVCAIGVFDDDELNAVLGIDGENHLTVYLATVGKK